MALAPSVSALLAVSLGPSPYISWDNLFKTQEEQMKTSLCEPRKSKSLLTQKKKQKTKNKKPSRGSGFPCGSAVKESAYSAGDLGSIPGLGRSPGEGKGYPLQYSGVENSKDYIIHGVAKSRTRLSDFHFTSKGFSKESNSGLFK